MNPQEILESNKNNYEELYTKEETFLRYPADWIIRFHNMFLRTEQPNGGKVLDFGCGSGNNSIFFMQKGYTVYGVDVAPSFKKLLAANLELNHIDQSVLANFSTISGESTALDFPDNSFDLIISNQVLYYMPNEQHLREVCNELKRVLRPGGIVFFTMMGPSHYYITDHLQRIHDGRIYEIEIKDKNHRLYGVKQLILLPRDEADLCSLFDAFEPVTVGSLDQRMFDIHCSFHYIFAGRK